MGGAFCVRRSGNMGYHYTDGTTVYVALADGIPNGGELMAESKTSNYDLFLTDGKDINFQRFREALCGNTGSNMVLIDQALKSISEETNKKLNKTQGIDNAGKILGVGEDGTIELQKQLKVFDWANAELPFTADQISNTSSGAGFVTNPTNFADGKTYFRYKCNATNFTWTNPNPQKGAVTITLLGWRESDKNYEGTVDRLKFVYSDVTVDAKAANEFKNGVKRTYITDSNKTLVQIQGNHSFENWVLLDMDVMSIVADYAAPSGTSITVDSALSDSSTNPVQNKVIKAELDKKIETVPSAGADVVGGVKADDATAADTQPVRKGTDGKLYTAPTSGGTTITVDSEMSDTSTNPVQNKVAKAYMDKFKATVRTANIGTTWTGSEAPYTQTLSVLGVTADSVVDIFLSSDATASQVAEYGKLNLQDGGQSAKSITLKAFGTKNTATIPVKIIIRGEP